MKLVLIEAIPLLLRAIGQTIEQNTEHLIVFQDTVLHRLEAVLSETMPDVLWLDTYLPEVRDGSVVKAVRKRYPALKILLFGTDETVPEIRKYFKSGVHAYLPKTIATEEITAALVSIEAGILYVPPSLNKVFASWLTDPLRKKKPASKLTQREQEILRLIVEEFTTSEIAKKLYIGHCTVETHRVHLIQKLGVKNTAGLVRVAFEAGWYGG